VLPLLRASSYDQSIDTTWRHLDLGINVNVDVVVAVGFVAAEAAEFD
jgi:hypothetical protein